MAIVKVYTEDSYGVSFFQSLINELKNDGDIDNSLKCVVKRIPGICSAKFTRLMNLEVEEYDKIIINVDADGDLPNTIKRERKHIPQGSENKVQYILNDYEIEEWILYSKNISYNGKPSKKMSQIIDKIYEKNMLGKILSATLKNSDEKELLKKFAKCKELISAFTCS